VNLTEAELRALVREAVARHAGRREQATVVPEQPAPFHTSHVSHVRLALVSGDPDGACLIEPAVRCNHCGYCQSYGH
jgi:hypothetical protein